MTLAFFFVSFFLGQFFPGPTPSPTPSPSPSPTAEPLHVSTRVENNGHSPIYVFRASLGNARNFQYAYCVSFRNVATKVATDVDLSFVVLSYRGDVEANWGRLDKGTFTAPINIDDHCWYGRLWPKHVVRRMNQQVVRVKRVTFADGTTWEPGAVFQRAYADNGTKLPEPVPAQGGPSSHGLPPATSTSPLAGGKYGAIFYDPSTFASGSAIDRPTAERARADALSACNAQSSGRNACRPGIEFSTQRCGALGVLNGSVTSGYGDNDGDARAMVLGKAPGAQVITVQCNSI
jgi:hypothetical protein